MPSLTGEGKMSKSVEGRFINLTDDLETIKAKLAKAPTDSGKGNINQFQEGPLTTGKINSYENAHKVVQKGVAALLEFVELFQGVEKRKAYERQYIDKEGTWG